MTMTGPIKTSLQTALAKSFAINGGEFPTAATTAINNYINIVNTPSVNDLITLINAIENSLPDSSSTAIMNKLKTVENVALVAFESLKIGNPEIDLILANNQYPNDDLGVTYASILADLKANLNDSTNTDTVAHFAETIFYTINALNPNLSLNKLTADIQATIDAGTPLATLVTSIKNSLNSVVIPSALNIKTAIYGNNIFSADAANLAADIQTREQLLNLVQVKNNLIAACENSSSNDAEFAQAIYNSLLTLNSHLLDTTRLTRDIDAAVSALGDLATLKANILANLNGTANLDTTTESLRDALFVTNALIPSDPHDLGKDLPAANSLLGLKYINQALIDATNGFLGDATALATAILNAITSNHGGNSLALAELVNDINASGDVVALASNIHTALTALNTDTLTASIITNALYSSDRIISGHKKDLVNDLITEQVILNYSNMIANLITAVEAGADIDGLAQNIHNNMGTNPTLTENALKADITATIDSGTSFGALQAALKTALQNAEPTAAGIDAALYGTGLIISADPVNAALDISEAETELDYKALIEYLKLVCTNATSHLNVATFVNQLELALDTFSGISGGIHGTLSQPSLINEINFNIANNIPNANDASLIRIAQKIGSALDGVSIAQDYTSAAINTAIFDNIKPSHLNRMVVDATTTENFINLANIKANIISLCGSVDSNTTASELATALLNAVVNGSNITPSLTLNELTNDITATLTRPISITELAAQIINNLNATHDNALTQSSIDNALYNNNAIISANPYEMGLDIAAASFQLGCASVKQNLLAYLRPISVGEQDISSFTLATGILNALKGTINLDLSADSFITAIDLVADISYTISQDVNDFYKNHQLVTALISALENTGNSAQEIRDAFFNPTRLLVSNGNSSDNLNDANKLLAYIEAIDNAQLAYDNVRDNIVGALNNLTGSYNSSDVANAIVNAINAPSPHLSASDLKENIDATNGSLSSIVAGLKLHLNGFNSAPNSSLIVDAIFNQTLASSTVNAGNLLTDIDSSISNTSDYETIINNIIANLNELSGNYVADDVARTIINGLDYISSGENGKILNTNLTHDQILDDIEATLDKGILLSDLVSNLITDLENINDPTAGAIAGAIFNSNTLTQAATDANAYNADLQAAAAAHSSLRIIQQNFENVGTYATSEALAYDIIRGIQSNTGMPTRLTVAKLKDDIDDTIANNDLASVSSLANAIYTTIYNSGSDTTVNNIVNGIFGNHIQTTYNANLLVQDLENYELSREPVFYGNIKTSFSNNFAAGNSASYDTASEFANLAVSTLNLQNPTWNYARVLSDVTASEDSTALAAKILTSISTATNATEIANAIYGNGNLVLSTVDADAISQDIGADISLFGGATGLASLVSAELSALPNGYTETDIANAIIRTITPLGANSSPHLSVADMAGDITYTIGYQGSIVTSLSTLVANIQSYLNTVIAYSPSSAAQLDSAIYNINAIVPSNSDEANFESDIVNAIDAYNNYAAVQTALGTISSDNITNAVNSVLNDILLPVDNYKLNSTYLSDGITNSITTTLADLIAVITTRVVGADVSNVNTAPRHLADAFFNLNAIIPINSVNLGRDITIADQIDNAVTLTSAIGDNGVCTAGASHVVYSCNVATIDAVIATNDCTLSGAYAAEKACDKWAAQPATDFYVSYDGINCSNYLGTDAAAYCKAGLDYLAV